MMAATRMVFDKRLAFMFDAVLARENARGSRLATATAISVLFHAGAIAFALGASITLPFNSSREVAVKFMQPAVSMLPPPPPPPLRTRSPSASRTEPVEHKPIRRPTPKQQAKEMPQEKSEPPESSNDEDPVDEVVSSGAEDGELGGVERGTPGGTVGGVAGGVLGGQLGGQLEKPTASSPMGLGPLQQTSGEPPRYSSEAFNAHIEGTLLVKCVLSVEGRLEKCRIIQSLPYMDQAVLDAMATWKYEPIHYRGKPIAVEYLFPIKVVIPHQE